MSAVAFFPWTRCGERFRSGDWEIAPFGEVIARGEIGEDMTVAVGAILESYGHKRQVDRSRIPILRHWSKGFVDELDDEGLVQYFEFRERLAFAALCAREFFGHRYWNSDSVRLVVQGFTPERAGAAVIVSRRRDGHTQNYLSKGVMKVTRPNHVPSCDLPKDIDVALLDAIVRAQTGGGEFAPRLHESVRLFVGANTDSPDVTLHAELVDLTSAFSRLADAWKDDPVVEHYLRLLPVPEKGDHKHYGARIKHPVVQKYVRKGEPLRAAWLRDAIALRGNVGHGRVATPPYRSAWNISEHLLLGAVVFPLAVKSELAKRRYYAPTPKDVALGQAFDTLASLTPLQPGRDGEVNRRLWRRTISRFEMRPLVDRLARVLELESTNEQSEGGDGGGE